MAVADCLFCGKEFRAQRTKAKHMKVCPRKPQDQYQCMFCSSTFPNIRGKTTHLNTCSKKPAE